MSSELTIATDTSRRRGGQPKSRQFRAYLLGVVEADALWDRGSGDTHRPIWMAYAASRGMSKPFTANARCGRRIQPDNHSRISDCYDFAKSSPHRWSTQDAGDGVLITTAYLPELFHLDPVIPPETVTFVSMPPRWWVEREAEKLREVLGADAEDAARAGLLAAYLDRRVGLPIPPDLRFQLQLYRALAASDLRIKRRTSEYHRDGIHAFGLKECGLEEPIAVDATHDAIAAFITTQVRLYFEKEIRDGQDRKHRRGRVLSGARPAPLQLRFDFAASAA